MEKGIDTGVEKGIHEIAQNGILASLSNEAIKLMTKLTELRFL
jgi:hypothetical protein